MTHHKRTRILVCQVSYKGYTYPKYVDVAVSEATLNGLNSTDWELRAQKFAGLAKQIKARLTKQGYDMEGKFLSEKEISVVQIRPVKGSKPVQQTLF